ncbi:carbon storage regulator [Bacillus subtilis]|uniref:carbon storage regulator n=2 Tax=cellular organisms TaxID=131567 RepID=UPI000A0F9A9A|nr:carbon storage regulator [Bacillus subtilis]MEC2266517.1 carbon storage regulator [Bacillus subtilis]MEC4031919.1 carbon storage regulator [Bacillus subtilis]MUG00741.1 carbon storage regulator [Bacillus tequilensis]
MALVLSRKFEESIVIYDPSGTEIKITVIKGKDSKNPVRVVIEAPLEFTVRRTEIEEKDFFKQNPLHGGS